MHTIIEEIDNKNREIHVPVKAQLTTTPCLNECGEEEKLHVIVTINNYVRFKRRYELYWEFKKRMEKYKNLEMYVVEIALGQRPFMVTQPNNPKHLQLRTDNELWHKENSINLMVQRLPPNWKYVAWIDADVEFVNPNFVNETIHQLQHYEIVQMFQTANNLGPEGETISTFKSFMYQYVSGADYTLKKYEFWHPGFAWACTKKAWNDMGGLLDIALLGAGDHHMALAFIGKAEKSLPGGISESYRRHVMRFQERCERHIKRDVGYVPGTILHYWHGTFQNRKYVERWQGLIENKYNPDEDIKRDWQGLIVINDDSKIGLRDFIRRYFRQRNEDGVDK